jgi:methyltransferase (TIGR00027 family)
MSDTAPPIRHISETALLAAAYRAHESDRPDALFRDPLARRLAGPRGEQIADAQSPATRHTWAWVMRTYLYDQLITAQLEQGVDLVVNLAAGLDARPYRMQLPATLRWVEVDLPDVVGYKEDILRNEKPVCELERVRLDLADTGARRGLFRHLGDGARRALILTEGILIYLTPAEVGALADDLAVPASFQRWILEIASPGLLRMMQGQIGVQLSQAGAPLKFGPEEGPEFFRGHGWLPLHVRSLLKTAARLKRVSLWMRLLALLPQSSGRQGSRPWAGVCLFGRQ